MKNYLQNYLEAVESLSVMESSSSPTLLTDKEMLHHLSDEIKGMAVLIRVSDRNYCCQCDPNDPELKFAHQFFDFQSFSNLIHHDDLPEVIRAKQKALEFRRSFKTKEIGNYKLILECRMKDHNHKYRRFMHQYRVIKLNKHGEIAFLLLTLHPLQGNKLENPLTNMMIVNRNEKRIVFPKRGKNISNLQLKIIKLTAEGLTAEEIADQMGSEKNTIYNQRRNILLKTQTRDMIQAVKYFEKTGLI